MWGSNTLFARLVTPKEASISFDLAILTQSTIIWSVTTSSAELAKKARILFHLISSELSSTVNGSDLLGNWVTATSFCVIVPYIFVTLFADLDDTFLVT